MASIIQKLCYLASGSKQFVYLFKIYMRSSVGIEPSSPSPILHFHMSKNIKLPIRR